MKEENGYVFTMEEEMKFREMLEEVNKNESIDLTLITSEEIRKIDESNIPNATKEFEKNGIRKTLEGKTKEEITEIFISNLKENPDIYNIFYATYYLPNRNNEALDEDLTNIFDEVLNTFELLTDNKNRKFVTEFLKDTEKLNEIQKFILQSLEENFDDEDDFEGIVEDIYMRVIYSVLYDEFRTLNGFELYEMRN